MSKLDRIKFVGDNPEPRCPVVLLVDTSYSMQGAPIAALNEGLQVLADQMKRDDVAKNRVELAVIAFGGTVRALDPEHGTEVGFDAEQIFTEVKHFNAPTLFADGNTPMGHAVNMARDMLKERRRIYKQHALDAYKPWIFLITDGEPTDPHPVWQAAAAAAREDDERGELLFFAVGVEGADMQILSHFVSAERPPLLLNGLDFGAMFKWVSDSLSSVSGGQPGEMRQIQDPTGPSGWGQVAT